MILGTVTKSPGVQANTVYAASRAAFDLLSTTDKLRGCGCDVSCDLAPESMDANLMLTL